jgi:hypothetical protein
LEYIQPTAEGLILRVRVQPRSSKAGITGIQGDCLKVCVNAPAAEGAANRACREALAKSLGVPKGRVEIVSGSKSREKRILLKGVEKEVILSRISEILKTSR